MCSRGSGTKADRAASVHERPTLPPVQGATPGASPEVSPIHRETDHCERAQSAFGLKPPEKRVGPGTGDRGRMPRRAKRYGAAPHYPLVSLSLMICITEVSASVVVSPMARPSATS